MTYDGQSDWEDRRRNRERRKSLSEKTRSVMADIVQRLREAGWCVPAGLCAEAADEIEQARAAIAAVPIAEVVGVLENLSVAAGNFAAYVRSEHGVPSTDTDDHNVYMLSKRIVETHALLAKLKGQKP